MEDTIEEKDVAVGTHSQRPGIEDTAILANNDEPLRGDMRGRALSQRQREREQGGLDLEEERILTLPPPPSYDVHVTSLSIGVPPYRLYIPTPIPIPVPRFITHGFRSRQDKSQNPGQAVEESPNDNLIVRNVTAQVMRGEMLAIIGGSGSGKTTLLHAIANRLGGLPVAEGSVSFTPSAGSEREGHEGPLGKKGLSEVVGFVRQNDYLLPHLTGMSQLAVFRSLSQTYATQCEKL